MPKIDVFPLLRLKNVAYGYADLEAPWAALQRGTGRHWLYVVLKGSCRVEVLEPARAPIELAEGDVLAVANDAPHSLRSLQPSAKPSAPLRVRAPSDRGSAAKNATAVLFVGSVPCVAEPLSELFPTVFHVAGDGSANSRRIAALVGLIEEEIAQFGGEPGSSAVGDRLADLILIELLRVETHRVNEANPVWVHGIADPLVARLVTRFHGEPGGHWNWPTMCRAASLSRSALDRRFRAALGESPKRYLYALRMRLAAAALAEGRQSITEIATSVGYDSGAAFHRAFHRKLGLTPGVYGRRSKTPP